MLILLIGCVLCPLQSTGGFSLQCESQAWYELNGACNDLALISRLEHWLEVTTLMHCLIKPGLIFIGWPFLDLALTFIQTVARIPHFIVGLQLWSEPEIQRWSQESKCKHFEEFKFGFWGVLLGWMAFSFGGFDFDSNFGLSGVPKTLIGTKDPALIQGTKVEA